jgi:hypothetical protein
VKTLPLAGTVLGADSYNANEKETAMFENRIVPFQNFETPRSASPANVPAYQYNIALQHFKAVLRTGSLYRWERRILHGQQWLSDLSALKPGLTLRGSFYAGIQVVPISSIIGSESRISDFDLAFHPVRETSRERWLGIAMAYLGGLPLPPVQLIQVGNAYFVRDGHHRISVSQAFGQTHMDAEVITWQAVPPFPWQPKELEKEAVIQRKLYPSI